MPWVEESAADVLPGWILWTRWALLPVAAHLVTRLLVRPLARLTATPPRDPMSSTWPANALALWSVRSVPVLACLIAGAFLYVLAGARSVSSSDSGPLAALVLVAVLVAAGDEKRWLMKRYAGIALSRRAHWRSRIAMTLLMRGFFALAAVVVLLASSAPTRASSSALIAAVVLLLLFWCGGGVWIARVLGLARPAGERLRAAVTTAATRGGVPAPHAIEIDAWMTNAIALPVLGQVAVTPRAIEHLDDEELAAVVAHELGHLQERVRLVLVGAPLLVFVLFLAIARVAGLGLVPIGCGAAGFVLSLLLIPRWMRAAEARADAFVHASVPDPAALARALAILHRESLVPPSLGKRASHPDLAQRQLAAGAGSTVSGAEAPRSQRGFGAFVLVAVAVLVAAGSAREALDHADDSRGAARLALALRGPDPRHVYDLARLEWAAGREDVAARLYRGGALLEPEAPTWPVCAGLLLAENGDCAEARARLVEAERLLELRPDPELEPFVEDLRDAVAECP